LARSALVWQLLTIVALGLAVRHWMHSQPDLPHTIRSLGILAPLLTVGLQCTTSMTPVGSSVIPTLNGMLFPVPVAIFLTCSRGC
jgi:hypothetical protein